MQERICNHEFVSAVNLANGYGYRQCRLCEATKPGWLTGPHAHSVLVRATTDGKEYTKTAHFAAITAVKKQTYF